MNVRAIYLCVQMKLRSNRLPHRGVAFELAVVEHESIEAFCGACECVLELLKRPPKSVGHAFFAMTSHGASLTHVLNPVDCFGSCRFVGIIICEVHGFPGGQRSPSG